MYTLHRYCETDSAPSPLPKAEITNRTAVYPFSTWPHQSSGSEMTTKEDASRTLQVPQMLIPWSTWQLGDHATRYHYGTNKFHKPTLHWFPEPLVYGWFNPCDYPGRKGHQTGHCSTLWRNFFGDYSDEHRRLDNSHSQNLRTFTSFPSYSVPHTAYIGNCMDHLEWSSATLPYYVRLPWPWGLQAHHSIYSGLT